MRLLNTIARPYAPRRNQSWRASSWESSTFQRGDLSAAQIQLELAKRSAPEDSTVRELLGDVYYGRGRTALAIREWQKALELDPRADILDKLKKALQENDQDINFDELRRPHFLLRYDGAVNELIGREVAAALESEYQELAEEFRFSPAGTRESDALHEPRVHRGYPRSVLGLRP